MLAELKRHLKEHARCTVHNLQDLKLFQIKFRNNRWNVRDLHGFNKDFTFYPYNNFLAIEGYLRQDAWRLEEGMTVVDGGAYIGEFAMYASMKVGPKGRVLMFEPDQRNIADAHAFFNQYMGGLPDNVTIIPAGLWNYDGTLRFASGRGAGSALLAEGEKANPGEEILEVPVQTLESAARAQGVSRLDFIKLDIEGAEIEVVESAESIIRRWKPRFAIASYHLRDGKTTSLTVEPQLQKFGLKTATGFKKHLTTWAWPE